MIEFLVFFASEEIQNQCMIFLYSKYINSNVGITASLLCFCNYLLDFFQTEVQENRVNGPETEHERDKSEAHRTALQERNEADVDHKSFQQEQHKVFCMDIINRSVIHKLSNYPCVN